MVCSFERFGPLSDAALGRPQTAWASARKSYASLIASDELIDLVGRPGWLTVDVGNQVATSVAFTVEIEVYIRLYELGWALGFSVQAGA